MRRIQTDVLVIGGGATGSGVLRDLAMRGFKCTLVERRDLAYGTTGRYHGLLHSGGRYAVKDPDAARECIDENRILRQIMPQCIEDTGGFFVLTRRDDPAYVELFLAGCKQAGIPVETVPIQQMLRVEPLLDPNILQCFRVPDASADSFLAAELNVVSGRSYGAQSLTYHEVVHLLTASNPTTGKPAVVGALCHDLVKDEDVQIEAAMVVNASGAWAGIIAGSVGIDVAMAPGKGSMLALNHRVVNTVINRCKLPSDGDILVPAHTVAVIGTTDIRVADPDHYAIEPWEIRMMLDEGEKIIPRFKEFRILRAWAGVRPLLIENKESSDRDISRAFVLIDHAKRDGIEGLITITSGKWTTYRKMAEVTVDKVCEKLGVSRLCRTHLDSLPTTGEAKLHYHHLGARLEKVEKDASYGQLVCECELVTNDEIIQAIVHGNAVTLDDIRRDSRLGMGPCQAGFCALRASGILHNLSHPPVEAVNSAFRDFLQERWKGDLPILWGQQLRQERLNELIYISDLNVPNLPGGKSTRLAAEPYDRSLDKDSSYKTVEKIQAEAQLSADNSLPQDVVVIGAGLAGLVTGWRASSHGCKTKVISKGWGSLYWSTGCIDVLGYQTSISGQRIESPIRQLDDLVGSNPEHPYAIAGIDRLEQAIRSFMGLCEASGYSYFGSLEGNFLLPTALGTLRPTCLAPLTMVSGDAHQKTPILIVGFERFQDFYPGYIADNLSAQGILTSALTVDLESLRHQKFITGMTLARLFDLPEFRLEVIKSIKPKLGRAGRVGFPAVLGLKHAVEALKDIEKGLGVPVFEICGLPPSIPGIRLHNLLVNALQQNHAMVLNGMNVVRGDVDDHHVKAVWSEAAVRELSHPAGSFVLASGGILGGGIQTRDDAYAQEAIFNLQITIPDTRSQWFNQEFLSEESQPIHRSGIQVNEFFQPVNNIQQVIFDNLYAVGTTLNKCDPIRERSMEGIALVTGYIVGESFSGRQTTA